MWWNIAAGLAAGACGSAALNMATYLDMLVRGRPASEVPRKVAASLTGRVATGVGSHRAAGDDDTRNNRLEGAGALLGYVNGLGMGLLYGVLEPRLRDVPRPVAASVVGVAAMAGSDLPSIALGATDPRTWGASGWVADIGPHLAYGIVAVGAYDLFLRAHR